jgi:hypothetical protein
MFDLRRDADEARRSVKLASLYHRGQELAWDGREVLPELIARHGGLRVADAQREALRHIFGVILWGELAAWKISLQLADELEGLESRMAATSQAHDEARHFYVMHDYLEALGEVPRQLDWASQTLLETVLGTSSLLHKLLGMQLMVESLALTIFQVVRQTRVEPVLCDLLHYYEKDEARHVGLGVQLLPTLMRGLGRLDIAALIAFQLRIMGLTLAGLKTLERHFRALGVDPKAIVHLGRAKQTLAFQELGNQMGVTGVPRSREIIIRGVKGVAGALFAERPGVVSRARAFAAEWKAEMDEGLTPTALNPDEAPKVVKITRA